MRLTSENSIGIFDSGIGGTSIWKEIHQLLPEESTIYLSDSKHAPYGQKSIDRIIELSIKNTEFLLERECKLIVVACNTATTNAISYLREHYKVPFIGIEPAIKPASLQTKTNKIGILATKGTLNSKLFETTSNSLKNNVEIIEQVGEGLVELIENGNLHSKKMTTLLSKYLEKLMSQHIDHLVLGCTHYPYLIPQINEITNNKITIIDSGFAVAKQTKRILEKHQLINNSNNSPVNRFYINTNTDVLKQVIENNNSIKIDYLDF